MIKQWQRISWIQLSYHTCRLHLNTIPYPLLPSSLLSHSLFYSRPYLPPLSNFPFFLPPPPTGSPGSDDSPLGSPHVVVNGNGSANGQWVDDAGVLGPGQIPEGQQLSPLTSPLLTEAGYVRNEDEDEARRKVGYVDREEVEKSSPENFIAIHYIT